MAREDHELLLQGCFDGELDLIPSVEFEEHVRTCPDCSQQFHDQPSHAPVVACSESLRTGPSEPQSSNPRSASARGPVETHPHTALPRASGGLPSLPSSSHLS